MSECVPQNRADLVILAELQAVQDALNIAMARWLRAFSNLDKIVADGGDISAHRHRDAVREAATAVAEFRAAEHALHRAQAALAAAAAADRTDAGEIPLH